MTSPAKQNSKIHRLTLMEQIDGLRKRLDLNSIVVKEGHSIRAVNPFGEHVVVALSDAQRERRLELLNHLEGIVGIRGGSERFR